MTWAVGPGALDDGHRDAPVAPCFGGFATLTGRECVGAVSATTARVADQPRVGVVVGRRRSAGLVSLVVLRLSGQSLMCRGMGLVIVEHVAWCFATECVC